MEKFVNHPCFSEEAKHTVARVHLPVAPRCNIQCNYCNRDFDCVNESRPGVTSSILSPVQAISYLEKIMKKISNVGVVGIAGPGDPLANRVETVTTFDLVRKQYPDIHLCLATNGLELPSTAGILSSFNVNHVTVTVNAVDPYIGKHIYAWVRTGGKVYRGIEGATILLDRQREGIQMLKDHNITVKINTVCIPGINDSHVSDVARVAASLGADIHNIIPMYGVEGTPFAAIQPLDAGKIASIRKDSSAYMMQMTHCQRCRADAAGLLGENNTVEIGDMIKKETRPKVTEERPCVAVASNEGLFVNQHLGEATKLFVYKNSGGKGTLHEIRNTPSPGSGADRWRAMGDIFSDCCAILASGFGKSPQAFIEDSGIQLIAMQGLISEGVDAVLNERDIPKILLNSPGECGRGISCGGKGTGCA